MACTALMRRLVDWPASEPSQAVGCTPASGNLLDDTQLEVEDTALKERGSTTRAIVPWAGKLSGMGLGCWMGFWMGRDVSEHLPVLLAEHQHRWRTATTTFMRTAAPARANTSTALRRRGSAAGALATTSGPTS